MPYRDNEQALRERLEALEREVLEVKSLKLQNAELRRRLAEAQLKLDRLRTTAPRLPRVVQAPSRATGDGLRITDDCINCGACEPECPRDAICEGVDYYLIDPDRCDQCQGRGSVPLCVAVCPVDCIEPG